MNTLSLSYAFGFTTTESHEDALNRTRDALLAEGFGVLCDIDVQATLRTRIGALVPPYVLLAVCSPPLAYRALLAEPSAGVLLPCNVAVYGGTDGRTVVAVLDPAAAFSLVPSGDLRPVGEEAATRLRKVIDHLRTTVPTAAPVEDVVETAEEIC